ncbi:hypothetical protein QBC44DRAFT_75028 [Cladorrhinum sp. PSN332]|nr:hypothetical protein QBC44DRAFT_75028 [Cladorrhinum sp. PSN332]
MPSSSSVYSSDGRHRRSSHHHQQQQQRQDQQRRRRQHSSPPPPRHHDDDIQSCCSSGSCSSHDEKHHAVIIHPRSREINRDRYALVPEGRRYRGDYDDYERYGEGAEGPEEYVVNPGHRYRRGSTGGERRRRGCWLLLSCLLRGLFCVLLIEVSWVREGNEFMMNLGVYFFLVFFSVLQKRFRKRVHCSSVELLLLKTYLRRFVYGGKGNVYIYIYIYMAWGD